jgi:hypothetical protein
MLYPRRSRVKHAVWEGIVRGSEMEKAHILREIVRTAAANGGIALGEARMKAETGISRADWFGIHWSKWSDAVREAGFTPNKLRGSFEDDFLFLRYADLARNLGRLPSNGDLRLKRRKDSEFPSSKVFEKFGSKSELVRKLLEFCRSRPEFGPVVGLCEDYLRVFASAISEDEPSTTRVVVGHVYLYQHGSRREYKIGCTNNRLRREGEIAIELPEKIKPIHVIDTVDPAGVEAYWHRRFAEKRLNGEWFELAADDVREFKRWRQIC